MMAPAASRPRPPKISAFRLGRSGSVETLAQDID